MLCLKIAGGVANSVDIDEMLRSMATHLSLLFAQACLSKKHSRSSVIIDNDQS